MLESRSHLTGVPLRSLALAFVAGLLVWLAAVAVGAHVRAASPGSADLSLHVETDRTVVPVGEDFTHTLTITNDGPDDAGGVVVAAPLPASWIFASAAPAADYDPENGNWDVGALASGESKVLQIVATMHGLGLLNVDVEVTTSDTGDPDSTPGNCCSGEDDEAAFGVAGALEADLSLDMVVDDPSPGVGSNVTFTLTLSNAGPNDAQALGVKDVLPSNMSFVSASPTDYDAGTGIWGIFRVATGESASIDIVATVNDTSTVTNYAELYISSYIDADSIRGNNSTNEDDDASVAVTGQAVSADLSLHAGGSPSLDARIGGPSGVQVTVTNNGPDTANDVVVRDNLASLSEFAFDFADTAESGADYDFATGTWDVGTLESGASETLEVHLTVTAAGEPTYRVEIVHSSAADPDSTPGNLEATGGSEDDGSLFGFLARGNSTDLSLDMSADDASSAVGANVTFTLTVRNHGPYTVLGVSVKDLLPAGLSFVSATPPPNTEYDSTTGVWTTGNLGSGDSAALLIVATVTSAPVTNYAEIVTADLDDPDSTPGNNSTTEDDNASVTVTAALPGNDDFADAAVLPAAGSSINGRVLGATRESGETAICPTYDGSVWYAWTPDHDGLGVYGSVPTGLCLGLLEGSSLGGLTPVTTQPFGIGFSTFRAIAGTTYHIVVEGSPGSSSTFSITFGLIASPANDDFADAEVLAGDTADITGTVVAASREIDEPTSCPSFAGSVWYAWTPDHDGLAGTESLPPAFCLEVYEGTALGTLARVPNLSSQGGTLFRAVAGTTYHIAVAGSPVAGSSPSFTIHRSFQALPGNDDFADAAVLPAAGSSINGRVLGATRESGETAICPTYDGSVWYAWTPDHDGLGVYGSVPTGLCLGLLEGSSLGGLTPVTTQPFGIGFSTFRAIAGTTYHIVVEGSPGSSSTFSITFGLIASPANDDFADAEVLAGDTADITGTVVAASREIDEPTSCPSFAGSVWYAWTPDHDGLAGTESLPPAFCLEVYEGTALGTLARVPNLSSQGGTLFRAVAGTTYHIAVAGSPVAGSSPSFTIHRSFQALPGNDDFADAAVLPAAGSSINGRVLGATRESGETAICPTYDGSVWYAWTPDHDGLGVYGSVPTGLCLGLLEGSSLGGLTPVTTQPFGIGFSTFRAIAGTTYHIVVEGSPGSSSTFSITFGLIASPANDDFADAEVLAGDTADITGTVVAASREIDEPTSCPSFAGSVWYAWTPDHDGLAGTESLPPAFCLEVYEGTALGTLARVPNLSSQGGTLFRAVAGTTYHIAVAGSPVAGSSPSFTIHRSFQASPPNADLSLSKAVDTTTPDPVRPGQYLVYTLTVANAGPGTAEGAQVHDVLPRPTSPADARWCEVVAPATTCDTTSANAFDSATAIPAIQTLAAGESRRFRIGYTLAADTPSGPLQNTASISSTTTDPNTANDSSSVTVLVDAPPTASFTYTPATPRVGDNVRFDANGSNDDHGITGFAWAFGDGGTGTGLVTNHAYSIAGSYAATLTVTDAIGGTSSATRTVVVSNVGPNPPPSAGRALRGTVTRIVAFGPGGDPAGGRVPLAGAVVTVGSARQGGIQTTTDAQGRYVFTNLSCGSCDIEVAAPGSTTAILQTSVTIGANPGLTVRDLVVGTGRDQLYVTGVLRPPATNPGDPQPPAPLTVGVRVYAGSLNNPNNIVADSARVFPGPGGFGAYQLLVGQIGRVPPQIGPGTQLQVVLVENGVNVTSTTPVTFRVPPVSAGFAPQVVTAADLVGPNPPPSAGRALRGTVTRIVAFGPGGDPAGGRVPLAGAVVTVGSARQGGIQTTTDAQGRYVFTNLSCGSCDIEVAAPGSTTAILQTSLTIGANPGLTVRDLVVGTGRDQLYVTGVLRPPATNPGDPQPPAPLTVGVRVYAGSLNNPNNIVADSARVFPGPGGFGAYQLLVGQIGRVPPQIGPGTQLQVVLVENGVNVTSTTPVTFRVPPVSAGFAPQVVTAADLVGR